MKWVSADPLWEPLMAMRVGQSTRTISTPLSFYPDADLTQHTPSGEDFQ